MSRNKTGSGLYHNGVSYAGGMVMLISVLMLLFFLLIQIGLEDPSPYVGIITFMVIPAFFTLGLLLFFWGMRRESLRRRKAGTTEALPYPRVDLNLRRHRRAFAWVLTVGSVVGVLLLYTGYQAFLYTESVAFCGTTCHTVMQPEYTAYLNGPHARVPCVDCHVGHGVDWYVKSKLSGARQVFAVAFDTYEKPIPVPVENLRPARETCEECHWPGKFWGAQLVQVPHFRYDRENTAEQMSLMVKTGGGASNHGPNAGIHWHMLIDNTIWFRPADRHQQVIPWFKVRRSDGSESVYRARGTELTEEEIAALPMEEMDCMHCHNRPSHVFPAPEKAVDLALLADEIPRDLPYVKRMAVDALTVDYPTREQAHQGIRQVLEGHFAKEGVPKARREDVERAVARTIAIYDRSVFPAMNVDWDTYANNIGHRNWPGCERCHDGRHVSDDGKVLTRGCTVCHTMPVRGPLTPLAASVPHDGEAWHPWPLEGTHTELLCSQCHRAGKRPPLDCASCHGLDPEAPMMAMGCDSCHQSSGMVQPLTACGDCHEVGGLHTEVDTHAESGCTTCHPPHGWRPEARSTCLQCHDDMADHEAPAACAECHEFTGG